MVRIYKFLLSLLALPIILFIWFFIVCIVCFTPIIALLDPDKIKIRGK
jgi:hypothetical protein